MSAQLLGRLGILLFAGAPDGDGGAGLGEPVGHAEADPTVAAGDEGNLPGEVERTVGHQGRSTMTAPGISGRSRKAPAGPSRRRPAAWERRAPSDPSAGGPPAAARPRPRSRRAAACS